MIQKCNKEGSPLHLEIMIKTESDETKKPKQFHENEKKKKREDRNRTPRCPIHVLLVYIMEYIHHQVTNENTCWCMPSRT